MTLVLFILAVVLIGWGVPRLVVDHYPGPVQILVASVVALAIGAGVIWIGAQVAEAVANYDAQTEFDRGFNAWKIMLLIAPASALHRRKQLAGRK
ncbi:MAG: hypothetical protein AAF317_18295 [Pseudomonadota bacterium]